MSRLARTMIVCIACLAASVEILSAAAPKASDIVKKSHEAGLRAILMGQLETTAYCAGGPVTASVRVYQSGVRTRMEYLSGPTAGRVIINDGSRVIALDPSRKTAIVTRTPQSGASLEQVFGNYAPVLVGSARIAGRDCYHVKLSPRRKGDPSTQLWIDKRTMFALRTDRYGSDGKPNTRTTYTKVDYSARPPASLFTLPKGWKTVSSGSDGMTSGIEAVERAVGFTPRKPGYVPKGYEFGGYCVRNAPGCAIFAVLKYTNGLNTISVFERKGACPGMGFGRGGGRGLGRGRGTGRGMGNCGRGCVLMADNPQARVVSTWADDIMIVVVGNIAQSELERMANSFK